MRTHSFDSERAAGLGLAALSALVAITCASTKPLTPMPAPPPPVATSPAPAPTPVEPPPVASSEPAPVLDAEAPKAPEDLLAHFHARLTSAKPVRIAWLGDSHTYADFWTHAVRSALQERYGNGGPGYLLVGIHPYRSGRAKITVDGKWRHEPSSPSSGAHQLDGTFGLLGMRAVPVSADARCTIEPYSTAVEGGARWTLLFREKGQDRFEARVGSGEWKTVGPATGSALPGSPIRRLTLKGKAKEPFQVRAKSGAPELFGVILESEKPGLVLDNLGINGARASTVLAWEEQAWEAELRAREPALVVLAYGTNEAASTLTAARYQAHEKALLERVKKAAPNADCLMIGPTDMATPEGGSRPRVAELDAALESTARESGCAFMSAYRAMGGEGGFAKWAKESPPLGSPDRIHLTPKGYEALAEKTVERLLPKD